MADTFKNIDCCIIGGGPAGIMAALSVRHYFPDSRIVILEKSNELARKLPISGAGRGNLTNVHLRDSALSFYHGDQNIISSVFSQFGFDDIVRFFTDLGIPLYEEIKTEKGKLFPVIDHAKTVRDILAMELNHASIEVFLNSPVISLEKHDFSWMVKTNEREFSCTSIVLATGGKSYPALGSDGSGFELAKRLGHTIVEPVISAVPLVSKNILSHYLQGEKIRASVTVVIDGKDIHMENGEVLFTQYGFSGPAVFDVSRECSVRINREQKSDVILRISFVPHIPGGELPDLLRKRFENNADFLVSTALWGLVSEKVANAICAAASIPKGQKSRECSQDELHKIQNILTGFEASITGTRGWNEGEFTAGGISTDEINPATLESKLKKRVFFAGEMIDVDGAVGGFNLSWAWASGWVAGKLV